MLRFYSTCRRAGALPTEAGLGWESLEIPNGVVDPLASFAAAFS
jgi:hypothetical protein